MKIALKELRESLVGLKILNLKYQSKGKNLEIALKESNELISIFVRSIETATKNLNASQN
jgi:hypothetical protein